MEPLHDNHPPDVGTVGDAVGASAVEYSATAAPHRAASRPGMLVPRSAMPTARKEEVHRLLCQVLIIRCQVDAQYAAPVVVGCQDDMNIYTVIERHLKREFLLGAERFWRLVRNELGVDTWRPRVQGAQWKALLGARLAEFEQEFQAIHRTADSFQECLKADSCPEALVQDIRDTIQRIKGWWENRNRKPDGALKRPGPAMASLQAANKRRVLPRLPYLDQHMGFGGFGEQPDVLSDPAAAAAAADAAAAAAAAAATAGFLNLGTADMAGTVQMPYQVNGMEQPAAAIAAATAGGPGGGLGGDLLGAAAAAVTAANPLAAFFADPSSLLVLDVGGTTFRTTLNTLLAVSGSLFEQVAQGHAPQGIMQRLPSGEVFIDRSGEHFSYILEYLRACASNDITFPLPNDARDLQALAREAYFYQLQELLQHIQHTVIVPQPSTRTYYDMLYLETGFRPLEEPEAMRSMERAKTVLMQQLNHIVYQRAQDGYAVQEILPGTAHKQRQGDSRTEHNLYYNVLLKKVIPLLPEDMLLLDGEQLDDVGDDPPQLQKQQHEYSAERKAMAGAAAPV